MRDLKTTMLMFAELGIGLVAGLCFSKAQYYKGKRDAYMEVEKVLHETFDPLMEEYASKSEEEES